MRVTVIVFPGSNRDRDMVAAISRIGNVEPTLAWHRDTELPASDLIVLPGGFSHGDYLRAGAIAARAPVMRAVTGAAERGVRVLGVCNGFQMLTEAGLLPGALMRNAALSFVCRTVRLEAVNTTSPFTRRYRKGHAFDCPVAHHDGNYFADEETLAQLAGENRIAFRYADGTNPNGSQHDIAGILNAKGNVLGMMPHPENLIEAAHGGTDGRALFDGALDPQNLMAA